jgi:hypothetical protein
MQCSAQEPNILLVVAYRKDSHATGSKTHMFMRRTCNRGSVNPKYESTQQDLTDETGWVRLRNAGSGNQGEVLAMIKVLLHKSY